MDYHRPRTVSEAIEKLREALPLAGGTSLVPRRRDLSGVMDLQDLELDQIRVQDEWVVAGAMVRLQDLVESPAVAAPVRDAARREAGWNIRNAASVGGVVVASDGRSALLAILLALESQVQTEPGGSEEDLDTFLDARLRDERPRLVTGVRIRRPVTAAYEQVARTPADRPLVCAAIGEWSGASPGRSVVLGGFGPRPVLVREAGDPERMVEAAVRAYAEAGDEWASAEYRSAMAGVLVRRLVEGRAAG